MKDHPHLFEFKTNIEKVTIPCQLNNPFDVEVSDIARIAASEFQDYILSESKEWEYDFSTRNGKMFGVLVVKKEDGTYAFLGTVSGTIARVYYGKHHNTKTTKLVPSVFDDATDDYFFSKGMIAITNIGKEIQNSINALEIKELKQKRSEKSISIQKKLFQNYLFTNIQGVKKNVLQIFENTNYGQPPAATGECAAPKLLQYASDHQLKPISLVEFWWGKPIKSQERKHKTFYPACESKCRPILEFMLDDNQLYDEVFSINEL